MQPVRLRTRMVEGIALAVLPLMLQAELRLETSILVTQVPRETLDAFPAPEQEAFAARPFFDHARVVVVSPRGEVRVLTEGFRSACDPDLSFDGQRVLFAGQRDPAGPWRIWEIGLDGTGLRAITPPQLRARSPLYVSTLFTLDSPEPWMTAVFVADTSALSEFGLRATSSLFNIKLDGTELRRMTFNPGLSADPFQTWDGRVIYATTRQPQEPAMGDARWAIHAIHIEGADMEYYGGGKGSRVQGMPCATDTGLVVFVESDAPLGIAGGRLACIEQARPTATYRRLTESGAHEYLYPAPLAGDRVLVARRPADRSQPYGLVSFDVRDGVAGTVFASPEHHQLQAKPVRPRPMPDGHSTVVNLEARTGVFYGLNSYTADAQRQAHLEPGTIKRVRLIEGVPASDDAPVPHRSSWPKVARRLIGEAPVETDGSFNVEVPADTPLLLQTLDEQGMALGTSGWIWVKPKETRGCIGCHEDPELIPENEFVLALQRESTRLTLPPEQRRSLSFSHEIAPVLQQHCAAADCHGGAESPLRLPLMSAQPSADDLRAAYDALMTPAADAGSLPPPYPGKYIDAGRARTSWLVWQLLGRQTARPWDHPPSPLPPVDKMPPPGAGAPLSPETILTLIQWIDMGAQFDPAASAASETPTLSPPAP
jgi:hypothetical protein